MSIFEPSEAMERLPEQFFAKLTKKVSRLKKEGRDIINLGQGNPDQPTPEHIVRKLESAARDPRNHGYINFRGLPEFKQAAADYYKREHGVDLDSEEEIAILFGAKAGLVEMSQCFLNPGDKALLPDPGYPDYMSGTALAGAEDVFMPLREENGFRPDYSEMDEKDLDEAKLMFLNYPNNPTAGTATSSFFEETVDIARKHDIGVIHDFAYGAIGYDGEKPVSFLETEGAKEAGVEIFTLSKSYNMAGWRIGFVAGNREVIEQINKLQDHMYVSLFGAVQEAAIEALSGDQSKVRELVRMYERRRDVFIGTLEKHGFRTITPKGTFFCWIPVPEGYSSEGFADYAIEQAGVVTAPGNGFGKEGEGYVRVGLLADEEVLREAAERLGRLEY
ncbi:pyridoxal phosphate-dependent aminotransferase [Salimicrobium halophilum]|uniref:Aminotransferase n=1 Tax=Salimicrobium halophilum TaxID=86666 RepID=A0A1G8UFC4_9BACI|nr:pyridoxal phosphate-dependent aminotransferase [Salimicrobium halophilum]SDJ52439.1 aminotransferase [Salimicrobium halophilum]